MQSSYPIGAGEYVPKHRNAKSHSQQAWLVAWPTLAFFFAFVVGIKIEFVVSLSGLVSVMMKPNPC